MIIDIKQPEKPKKLPTEIDLGDKKITNPTIIKEYERLQQKKADGTIKANEKLRLSRIKKQGDDMKYIQVLQRPKNKATRCSTLKSMNNLPVKQDEEKLSLIIDDIFDGMTMIEACDKYDIKPRFFMSMLEKEENRELKEQFLNARITLAEYYLYRREKLEKDLLDKKIDTTTYSALSQDYKFLAGKLAPLAYGDKIQFDAQINRKNTVEVINSDKVLELNKLLTSSIIDAEFEEEKND